MIREARVNQKRAIGRLETDLLSDDRGSLTDAEFWKQAHAAFVMINHASGMLAEAIDRRYNVTQTTVKVEGEGPKVLNRSYWQSKEKEDESVETGQSIDLSDLEELTDG